MISQLSGERPKAFESRSAISELMPLLPFKIRLSVEGETLNLEESCLPVIPKAYHVAHGATETHFIGRVKV